MAGAILLALWLARVPILIGFGEFLSVGDEAAREERADLIYVLGGDWMARSSYAAELYRAGVAPRVLLIRVADNPAVRLGLLPNETETTIGLLRMAGVPADAIVQYAPPGIGVESTGDEAARLREFLRENPHPRVVFVTTWFHTRRARWLLRRGLRGVPVQMVMAGASTPTLNARNWWRSESGLVLVFEEYLKFAHNLAFR